MKYTDQHYVDADDEARTSLEEECAADASTYEARVDKTLLLKQDAFHASLMEML